MIKMPGWFVPAVTALLLWGVWGLFQKLATNQMPPRNVYLVGAGGAITVVLVMLASSGFSRSGLTREESSLPFLRGSAVRWAASCSSMR